MFIRHSYRVVKLKGYDYMHRAEFRPWWWPFWCTLYHGPYGRGCYNSMINLCHRHAEERLEDSKKKRKVYYLGRLP